MQGLDEPTTARLGSQRNPLANQQALAGCAVAVVLLACSDPLPPSKHDYIGQWTGTGVTLEIEAGGSIHYRRSEGGTHVEINAPIAEFQDHDFVVGMWKFKTTFKVSSPPHWDGESWTMVVDGRRLSRPGEPQQ